jgi:hypothetical protein
MNFVDHGCVGNFCCWRSPKGSNRLKPAAKFLGDAHRPAIDAQQAQASLQPLLHSILEMGVLEPDFRKYPADDRAQFLRNHVELCGGKSTSRRYESGAYSRTKRMSTARSTYSHSSVPRSLQPNSSKA